MADRHLAVPVPALHQHPPPQPPHCHVQVQEHTDQIWKFQRHDLIEEYHGRPPAPPPLILLNHLQLVVWRGVLRRPASHHKLKEKLEKNEEAALLSWEMYLKENYLQHQQCQEKQNTEQMIRDIAQRVDVLAELLDLDRVKRTGVVEQRLGSLEDQVHQSAQALRWMMQALRGNGFSPGEDVPPVGSSKALDTKEIDLEGKPEESQPPYHVLARNLLYPGSHTLRFPVPDEKVPWEVDFPLYNPPAFSADHKDMAVQDPFSLSLESLLKINYNTMDGLIDRQSFHGLYAVQDGLPLNPMGRTGLRGRGRLHCFGPNHALHPVVTRWRRNLDGSIIRKSLKKMLEVLVAQYPLSDVWALPGGSLEPGETLPLKLKWILRREFWPQFQNLLKQGTEVHRGYLDDPRNTDNAWVETVAISVHFDTQNDVEMKRLNSFLQGCDPELCIRWQVLDKRIPLHTNHKELLHKVSTLLGAYY
ncbi:transient receptor potential cation channel subfamily M member 2 isoform X5 [Chamaea fasciata]|uniref:transient receptor potential cation channel subfamily M member 2 isoform X5 n=1 Tax=Chamaea fasciata TaxID=190680 RepID=UPI00336A48E5